MTGSLVHHDQPRVVAILLAAGSGSRSGQEVNKIFFPLAGVSVLERAASSLLSHPRIASLVLVLSKKDEEKVARIMADKFDQERVRLTLGGDNRQESAYRGLLAARAWMDQLGQKEAIALIHDAARCFLPPELISRLLDTIRRHHCGAGPVLAIPDTVRLMDADGIHFDKTLARERLAAMQTPQGADLDVLIKAASLARTQGRQVTDDLELLLGIGYPVRAVQGDPANFKLTLPQDFDYARFLCGERGFDPLPPG